MLHAIKSRFRGILFRIYVYFCKDAQFEGKRAIIGHNSRIIRGKGARLLIKGDIRLEDNVLIAARKGAIINIGKSVFCNSGCQIICRKEIAIGNNVQFGHGVIIVDHDHDFRCEGGIAEGNFICDSISIGDNVWIGANTVILRGTNIGNNAVIGAGSVIKGVIKDNNVVIQKRDNKVIEL